MTRSYNFYAGPATLPLEVLEEAQANFCDYQNSGMSIMESSHRGKEYDAIHAEAIANYKELMNIPEGYSVLLLQGGASTQFAVIPMNLLGDGQTADYINTGAWAGKAIKEAKLFGNVNVVADTSNCVPATIPAINSIDYTDGAEYLHITSNETISGAQWKEFPKCDAPLIADMSSDILSREINVADFGMIYAGAQKNLGPSGCALVIIRDDLAEKVVRTNPTIFQYKTHVSKNSLYNTPASFTIYMMCLVTRWIKKTGKTNLFEQNVRKAKKIYDLIDSTDFYTGCADKAYRSDMNVTFTMPTKELEAMFLEESVKNNMWGLKGHRDVGGLRASIYNAFPEEGVDKLVELMKNFEQKS
jgi:phosphoserine aminotransferase